MASYPEMLVHCGALLLLVLAVVRGLGVLKRFVGPIEPGRAPAAYVPLRAVPGVWFSGRCVARVRSHVHVMRGPCSRLL